MKLRGDKVDIIQNLPKDIYEIDIYQSEITNTKRITKEEYYKKEEVKGKLTPELIETLIEKPKKDTEKQHYIEDVRTCIIYDYKYESFKKDRTCFAIVTGEIVFQIEYRVKETITIDVPNDEEFTITAGEIRIKRAAIKATPKKSGENLSTGHLFGFILGIFQLIAGFALLMTLVFAFRDFWQIGLILGGIILGIWFLGYFAGNVFRIIGKIVRLVLFFLAMGFGLLMLLEEFGTDREYTEDIPILDSTVIEDLEKNKIDSLIIDSIQPEAIHNNLSWTDFNRKSHSFNYSLINLDFYKARKNRAKTFAMSWAEIYQNLLDHDNRYLKDIFFKYDSLRGNLNALEFARLVVSSIQEVPYTWILPESCFNAANSDEINRSGYSCLGNVQFFGVQSPLEFMANHKGDCDTKALVIYAILKHFNYDVCILSSEQYAHAMLGISLPANGKFKHFRGKRYYFWETTAKGANIGELPPTHSNLSFWNVVLF